MKWVDSTLSMGQQANIMNAERDTMAPITVFLRFAVGEKSAMISGKYFISP
jgi:hypothetical protein